MEYRNNIVLLTNTYPHSGELFLRTEIGFIPEGVFADIWSFFFDRARMENKSSFSNVTTHTYNELSAIGKIRCMLNAIYMFIGESELKEVFEFKGFFRNVVKAIKFAYISEIRLVSIKQWLKNTGYTSGNPLIYSYWLYETAYVGARLKTENPQNIFITRCHGYDLYEERHPNGYLPFRQFILKNADMICPISEDGKKYLHDRFNGRYDSKIKVMRLGTIRCIDFICKQKKTEKIILVSCSNLVEVKRVDLIIRALNKCDKEIVWYHFGDGVMRSDLEKQAQSLPTNVKYFFMGFQENKEIQKFYANHYIDAFVNVSQSEGVPVSIMEAESYGVPVIATNVGGTSEIVHDRQNGVLLSVDFTDADLLNAIDDVLSNADQYRKEALRTWENMSNANVVFPEFYKMLEEL